MQVLVVVLSVLLAFVVGSAGVGLLQGSQVATVNMDRLSVPPGVRTLVGVAELLAAAGLLAGLVVVGLGTAAAAGVIALMAGAMAFHLRAHDPAKEYVPAVVTGVLAVLVVAVTVAA